MLSEMKSDVENLIKNGRKQAETNPEITPKVDALKELYNRCGGEVTARKTQLDAAYKVADDLDQMLLDLNDWAIRLEQFTKTNGDDSESLKVCIYRFKKIKSKVCIRTLRLKKCYTCTWLIDFKKIPPFLVLGIFSSFIFIF